MICKDCKGSGKDDVAVKLEKLGAVLPLNCVSCRGTGQVTIYDQEYQPKHLRSND